MRHGHAERPMAGVRRPSKNRFQKGNRFMARKVEETRKQTFRYTDASALRVLLVGDFTHWQEGAIAMRKGPNGTWSATVDLPPGKHTYRFIVDGEWTDDPDCTMRVSNPYGGQDMVRQVV